MKKVTLLLAIVLTTVISCKTKEKNNIGKIQSITFMLPDTHTAKDLVHMSFYTLIETKSRELKLLNAARTNDTSEFNVDSLKKRAITATYFISLNGDTVMRSLPYSGEKVGDPIIVESSTSKQLSDPLW